MRKFVTKKYRRDVGKPVWTHDSDCCSFLGHYDMCDLYVCRDTLIARYSDEGPDYKSTLVSIAERYKGTETEDAHFSVALVMCEILVDEETGEDPLCG